MADDSVFSSPSKRHSGVMNLPSPRLRSRSTRSSRQSSPAMNRGILSATPRKNGRAGLVSPARRSDTELDRSAVKRATRMVNYAKLMDGDDEDAADDDDMALADKIIAASKLDGGAPVLYESDAEEDAKQPIDPFVDLGQFETEKKTNFTAKLKKVENFEPMPVPRREDDLLLEQKRFDDRPLFLDGFEGYFEQHKTKVKTSGNTLAQLSQLEYDEYARNVRLLKLLHTSGKQHLWQMHKQMFHQWYYELLQGFNLCFYGVGSKREMLLEFTRDFLLPRLDAGGTKCCVINGYNTEITLKEVADNVSRLLLPESKTRSLSKNVREMLNGISRLLPSNNRPFMDLTQPPKLILLIHNLDGKAMRDARFQSVLTSFAQLNCVWTIASVDNVNAPLFWESSNVSKLRFVWHDLTTFEDYGVEHSFKDVLSLGKSTKFSGSKGAKYVLSSLTANSKSLYRILLSNQSTIMAEDPDLAKKPDLKGTLVGSVKFGLELKKLYQLCAEEFVASNDVSFRTMLQEFVEHKMCNLVKDASGTEFVFVPFTMDEINNLIEEALE